MSNWWKLLGVSAVSAILGYVVGSRKVATAAAPSSTLPPAGTPPAGTPPATPPVTGKWTDTSTFVDVRNRTWQRDLSLDTAVVVYSTGSGATKLIVTGPITDTSDKFAAKMDATT